MLLGKFVPRDSNLPLRFGHWQLMIADSGHAHALRGARYQRDSQAGAYQIEEGKRFIGFLNNLWYESGAAAHRQNVIIEGR